MKIGEIIKAGLAAGKDTAAILKDVKAAHPDAQTTSASVAWYRSQMKKELPNMDVLKAAPRKVKEKPPVKAPAAAAVGDVYTVDRVRTLDVGDEGGAYTARLLRNGKPVAEVEYGGTGGEVEFHFLDKTTAVVHAVNYADEPHTYTGTEEEARYWAYCLALPKWALPAEQGGDGRESHMTIDIHVEELVNDALLTKDVKKYLRGRIMLISKGKVYTVPVKLPAHEPVVRERIAVKHPDAVILNDLPIEQAVAKLRDIGWCG